MTHKHSGIRVSPTNGIKCDGHQFTLKANDITLDDVPLGRGSSGAVWRGSVKSTGMPVAVKTVRVDSKDDRKLLLNEVATLVKVEGCPNLVQWFAGFASQKAGEVFLVLELMDGGSMTDIWNKHNGVPPGQLAAIARQVLTGLHHLHSMKLVHNDIKPGNVLYNGKGEIKVADFGITKVMQGSLCGTCTGTQTYLAPEKFNQSYGCKADVWSFGVFMFELATGRHPFAAAKSFPEVFSMVCVEAEPRLQEADGHPFVLCDFVERCLTRDKDARYDAATLLKHDFISMAVSDQELCSWLAA